MKKLKMVSIAIIILASCAGLRSSAAPSSDLIKIRATCYCEPGLTYSGCYTREGIISGRKEDIGKVAAIYEVAEDGNVGDFIGYFEFLDCGAGFDTDGDGKGDSTIRGETIDIFRDDMDGVKNWIKLHGDYVYMKVINCEG